VCADVELELSQESQIIALMTNLNKELFSIPINAWNDILRRSDMPQTFEQMLSYIDSEYVRMSSSNPGLINRIENKNKEKSETSFETTESEVKSRKCKICEKNNHVTDKCKFRDSRFSVNQNRNYFINCSRKHDAAKDDDKASVSSDKSEKSKESKSDVKDSKSSAKKPEGTYARPPDKKKKGQDEESNYLYNDYKDVVVTGRTTTKCLLDENSFNLREERTGVRRIPEGILDIVIDRMAGQNIMSRKAFKLIKSKLGSISNESIDTCDTVFGRINIDQSNCSECEMILYLKTN
jgi:hypothetical protein